MENGKWKGKLENQSSGAEAYGSEWLQNVKMFVSHVNVYQKASTTEEAPNNQVDKIIQPTDIS